MQERMDETWRAEQEKEERRRFSEREKELLSYRKLIERQEKELDAYRSKLKAEQLDREKELQQELEAREKFFVERERQLFERQREYESHLMQRQAETEALRNHLEKEISLREAELQEAYVALQQERERYNEESRRKIEETSKDYVSDALETLSTKEKQFHFISKVWSITGASALVFGMAFFAWVTISSTLTLPSPITWEFITFSIFKGLIALTFIAGLAKYAFLFSKSYMYEALKNADRRHAINFGKFYLESYGAAADWSQVKEAFEHWNIAGDNAFSPNKETSLELTSLEKAVALIERVSKSLPIVKSEKDA